MKSFHPQYDNIPKHVGIIPDGGRRWAKTNNYDLFESYSISMELLCKIILNLFELGVETVSIFLSSIQNFKRTPTEINAFIRAEHSFCINLENRIGAFGKITRIRMLGDKNVLDNDFRKTIIDLELRTGTIQFSKEILICMAYDPFDEIKQIALNYKDSIKIEDLMWTNKPVDLIIRTGGVCLLSNFMLLQSGFARIKVLDKLFNDITLQDITEIIKEFSSFNRKYGE